MSENKSLVVKSRKFTNDEISLLRQSYLTGLDDVQTSLFLKQAESLDLNPFTKEIYGLVISGRLTLITSIGGLRKIAHLTGTYLGCKTTVNFDDDGNIYSATAIVKKLVGDKVAEFEAEVLFSEYNRNDGQWKRIPVTMIKKTAEAHALRMAFPQLAHLSEESEVGTITDKSSSRARELTETFKQAPAREVEEEHPDLPINPGECVAPLGKHKGKKISEIDEKDLVAFVDWAKLQKTLDMNVALYLEAVKAYLNK